MAKIESNVPLIGREKETKIMKNLLQSKEAELLAVIGRRRVGKTFLIKKIYHEQMTFQITGIQHANKREDLFNFVEARNNYFPRSTKMKEPNDWFEAFSQLKKLIKPKAKKQVLFFDELPWLAIGTMDFLKAFVWAWNCMAYKYVYTFKLVIYFHPKKQ
jgi:AAA+ ATPase superfamily predicted ATPase